MPKPNGIVIRGLRKEHGFTQEELATDAGISRAHLASLETERREATSPVMRRVARALGLRSPESIIKDEHGAIGKYNEGCRCEVCKSAQADRELDEL